MALAVVVEAGGEEGAGVAGVDMITKEVMVGTDTKVDMGIKVDTRVDITTKVAMGAMVMIKVDMEDMVSCTIYF
jgi:hypothetical protein